MKAGVRREDRVLAALDGPTLHALACLADDVGASLRFAIFTADKSECRACCACGTRLGDACGGRGAE